MKQPSQCSIAAARKLIAATMTEQVLMLAERLKRWASQFATSNTAMAYDLREAAATLQGSAALPSEAMIEAGVSFIYELDHNFGETSERRSDLDVLRDDLSNLLTAMRAATPTPDTGLIEALTDVHDTLVKFKVARRFTEAGIGGLAREISRLVNKTRTALANAAPAKPK